MHICCKTVLLTCSFVYIGHFDDLDCLSGATCARTKLLTGHTCDNPFCSPLMPMIRETCGLRDTSSRLRQLRVLAHFERFSLRMDSRFANEEDVGNVRHSKFLLCQPSSPTVSKFGCGKSITTRQTLFARVSSMDVPSGWVPRPPSHSWPSAKSGSHQMQQRHQGVSCPIPRVVNRHPCRSWS